MTQSSIDYDKLIEPFAVNEFGNAGIEHLAIASCAISLKRIADFLCSGELGKAVFDPHAPTNVYGEGLVDGIQNAIERGQRGINTNG